MEEANSVATEIGCSGCGGCDARLPEAPVSHGAAQLDGWRLASASVLLFLVPLLFAVVGATLFGSSPHIQLAGTWGGLALGAVCSKVAAGRLFGGREAV